MKKKQIKKIIATMLVAAMTVSVATGCGKNDTTKQDEEVSTSKSTESKEEKSEEEKSEEEKSESSSKEIEKAENKVSSSESENSDSEQNLKQWPEGVPMVYYFSSGVGGWGTELTINNDLTFTGEYHDSEMGSIGDDHPNGMAYVCSFSGSFSQITKVDDYTYKLDVESLTTEKAPGEQWIEDGVLYESADAYGMEDAEYFMLYIKGRSTEDLNGEFLTWVYDMYDSSTGGYKSNLTDYCLHNPVHDYAFCGYEN